MQTQITLESLDDKMNQILKEVKELNHVTVVNGGDMPISYNRKDFNQFIYNKVTFKSMWSKAATFVGIALSVLTILNIFKTWSK